MLANTRKITKLSAGPGIGARFNSTHKVLLLLIVMNLLWGASWVPYKVILSEMPVPVFACVRLILAVLLLAPFAIRDMRAQVRAGGQRFGMKQLPRLLILTLVGVVLNNIFLYNGATLAPATDASLLAISETLFTAMLAWLFLHERFGLLKLLGLALGAFGVYVLVAQGLYLPHLSGNGQALGDLLLLVGFGFESLYTLLGASSARRYPPLALLTATNLAGLLFWGPAAVVSMREQHWALPVLDWQGVASLTYLILVCSVIGYAVWFKTLRRAEASLASVTLFVQPLAGALVGAVLLGEVFTIFHVFGGGLVVVSLGLLVWGASRAGSVRPNMLKVGTGTPASVEYVALGAGAELGERLGQSFEQVLGSVEAGLLYSVPPSKMGYEL